MYKHGHGGKKSAYKGVLGTLIAVSLLVAGLWVVFKPTDSNNRIQNTAAVVTSAESQERNQIYDGDLFTFELPVGWKFVSLVSSPHARYTFHDSRNGQNRTLTIDVDGNVSDQAVDKLLPVKAAGDQMLPGTVSSDCAGLVEDPADGRQSNVAITYNEALFICDRENNTNKIGVSSSDGLNNVALAGSSSGQHNYFFTYVDHNINPTDRPLLEMINSFHVK